MAQTQRRGDRTASRDAAKNPLARGQQSGRFFRLLLRDIDDSVELAALKNLRHVGRLPAPNAGNTCTIQRLHPNDLDGRVLFFQEFTGAHDGPGGAHGADEMGDRARGVPPDLRAGRVVMRERVIGIGKLIEHPSFAVGFHTAREIDRSFHATLLRHQNDFGAVGFHDRTPLAAHVLWHQQNHAISTHRRDHG